MPDDHPRTGSLSRGSAGRNLRIVKLTPVALSFCHACNMEFQSTAPTEDEAEAEMRIAFDMHTCPT